MMRSRENHYIRHTVRSHGAKLARMHMQDWLILLLLAAIDGGLNIIEPFHRYVSSELMTNLKYPFKIHDTVPMWAVPVCIHAYTTKSTSLYLISILLLNLKPLHVVKIK